MMGDIGVKEVTKTRVTVVRGVRGRGGDRD